MMMAKDLVCGMMVNPTSTPYQSYYKNEWYYFCKIGCQMAFERDPEKYLERESRRIRWSKQEC